MAFGAARVPNAAASPGRLEMSRFGAQATVTARTVDLGAARTSSALRIDIALKPRNPAALARFVAEVSNPGSKQYHHFLAKGQFGRRFGPTMRTVSQVRSALRADGLNPGPVSGDRLMIPVITTVGRAERAFRVRLHRFRLPSSAIVDGNVNAPSVPRSIRKLIQSVVGLNNLARPRPAGLESSDHGGSPLTARAATSVGSATPCEAESAADPQSVTPDQLAHAYDVEPLYDEGDFGSGESVALFEMSGFNQKDLNRYVACSGIRAPTLTSAVDNGNAATRGIGAVEATSDIEVLAGIAPGLNRIDVYEAPLGPTGLLDEYSQIEQNDGDQVVSTSWVFCEPTAVTYGLIAAENTIFAAMAAQGQTLFAAAGDNGTEGCRQNAKPTSQTAVDDPASQPYVTGVGGTVLTGFGNSPGWAASETAWPRGGGGISGVSAMPSWQTGAGVINSYSSGVPCDHRGGRCREVPDVSASATNYAVYSGGRWVSLSGTSLAAPLWAGLLAMIDAAETPTCHPPGRLGFVDPALYYYATNDPADFSDVTTGRNNFGRAKDGAYPATSGYDMATGLGTPVAANLAQSFGLCGASLFPQPTAIGMLQSTAEPALAASNGTLYAAFINGPASPVYYQSYGGPGTVWGSPASTLEVGSGGGLAQTTTSPAIAILDGMPVVAWTDATSGAVEDSSLISGSWSPAMTLAQGAAQSTLGPALAAGGGGLYAAWRGHATNNVYFDVSNATGSGWQPQQQVPGATTDVPPAIVYDPNLGVVIIAWMDSAGGDHLRDELWSSSRGFYAGGALKGADSGNGPALAVVDNRLIEAHRGVDNDEIYFSAQPVGQLMGTWSPLQPLAYANTDFSPALAASGNTLYSAWLGTCSTYDCAANTYYTQFDPAAPR
jgi:kumamolisin